MKMFAVIDHASINNDTGFRKLIDERIFDKIPFELMIEVIESPMPGSKDYVPISSRIREKFPEIKRAFVDRLVIQY